MSAYLREDRVLPIGIPFMEENVQGLTLFGAKVGRELAEEDGRFTIPRPFNVA